MRDWASSGRVKIERANEHIRHLEREITAFKDSRPYPLVPDKNPNENLRAFTDLYNVFFVRAYIVETSAVVDPRWSAIAADAIHNLHVAMDHLWQRALYGPDSRKRDHFPAFQNPKSAKARFKGKEKGRVKAAVDILRDADCFRPNNPFWDIRCFDDTDKHDSMVLVACVLTGVGAVVNAKSVPVVDGVRKVRVHMPQQWIVEPRVSIELPNGRGLPVLENGTKVYALHADESQVNEEHQPAFEIAFGEGEVLKGQAVVPAIKQMAQAVDGLASAFIAAGLLK